MAKNGVELNAFSRRRTHNWGNFSLPYNFGPAAVSLERPPLHPRKRLAFKERTKLRRIFSTRSNGEGKGRLRDLSFPTSCRTQACYSSVHATTKGSCLSLIYVAVAHFETQAEPNGMGTWNAEYGTWNVVRGNQNANLCQDQTATPLSFAETRPRTQYHHRHNHNPERNRQP